MVFSADIEYLLHRSPEFERGLVIFSDLAPPPFEVTVLSMSARRLPSLVAVVRSSDLLASLCLTQELTDTLDRPLSLRSSLSSFDLGLCSSTFEMRPSSTLCDTVSGIELVEIDLKFKL